MRWFILVMSLIKFLQAHDSCSKYCDLISSGHLNAEWRPECVCPSENKIAIEISNDKRSPKIDETIYYEPAEIPHTYRQSFAERPFYITNPTFKKDYHNINSVINNPAMLSSFNKPVSQNGGFKRKHNLIHKIKIEEDDLPLYLDIDVHKSYHRSSNEESGNEQIDQLLEQEFTECIDLHILEYCRNNSITDSQSIWKKNQIEKYRNLSDSELRKIIQTKCRRSMKLVEESLKKINKSLPGKPEIDELLKQNASVDNDKLYHNYRVISQSNQRHYNGEILSHSTNSAGLDNKTSENSNDKLLTKTITKTGDKYFADLPDVDLSTIVTPNPTFVTHIPSYVSKFNKTRSIVAITESFEEIDETTNKITEKFKESDFTTEFTLNHNSDNEYTLASISKYDPQEHVESTTNNPMYVHAETLSLLQLINKTKTIPFIQSLHLNNTKNMGSTIQVNTLGNEVILPRLDELSLANAKNNTIKNMGAADRITTEKDLNFLGSDNSNIQIKIEDNLSNERETFNRKESISANNYSYLKDGEKINNSLPNDFKLSTFPYLATEQIVPLHINKMNRFFTTSESLLKTNGFDSDANEKFMVITHTTDAKSTPDKSAQQDNSITTDKKTNGQIVFLEKEMNIPKIITREFVNDTVTSEVDGTEDLPNNDFEHKIKNVNEVSYASKKVDDIKMNRIKVDTHNQLLGRLYFVFKEYYLPMRFIPYPNGQLSLGIDGETLCDKITKKSMSDSMLMSAVCKCIQSNTCANMNFKDFVSK